ncbi:MAG: hypothetical protein AVDCRST_MAG93-6566 [uncultured Chloroflexia bacterium]|uniref:Uncharacterized protein n=1 Tax=uncultured Chloroflexia bacterium TaxID=1672391 RepID=A0A6J4LRA9_9CHLR|nr:MAG: hypothetical protein AVDCRST_MAG93-6566 [uncultured Chloroflexia bacterium]
MSPAPRTAGRATAHRPQRLADAPPAALAAVETFLEALYGEQPGWIEVWHGHTDPAQPDKIVFDHDPNRWQWYEPARRAGIAALLVAWAGRYKNVYTSTGMYDRAARPCNGGVPLPSRVVFVDDAKDAGGLVPAIRLITSHGNAQHVYRTREPMDPATRRELQARAAAALGCDKSGSDIEQVLRVPASFNTKHGGRYPVHVESISEQTYGVDELRAAWPEVPIISAAGGPSSIDWAGADVLRANIEQLVNPDGVPWRFKNSHGQARRVIEGKLTPLKPDGTYDPSLARAFVTRGLILHGYEDTPAAAILLHLDNFHGTSNKGTSELKADIARLIGKYRADPSLAHVVPTPIEIAAHKPAQPQPDIPRASRARKDRPQVIDADGLLALYSAHADEYDQISWTQTEAARRAGASRATITRLEDELRERRDISNRKRGRNGGCLLILNCINIPKANRPAPVLSAPPAPEPAAGVDTISNDVSAHSDAENEPPRAYVREGKHTAPAAPPPVPPAPPTWYAADGPLTARDTDAGDYAQVRIGPLPKRRPVADRPPDEQRAARVAQLAKVRTKAKRAKLAGMDHLVPALRRAAANIGEQLAALDAGRPPAPIGEQPTLAPGPLASPEAAPTPAACVSPLPRPDGGALYAVDYWINHGELANAWRIIELNRERFDFAPELARLSAAGGATP